MDTVMSSNNLARFGKFFSKDGWQNKYTLTEWLNKYLPLWLSKFLAQDVFVIFTDAFHLSKTIMILTFCLTINQSEGVWYWLIWSAVFSPIYVLIRSI